MNLSEITIDIALRSYLEDGDPKPLKEEINNNPEILKDERVKEFFFGLLDGKVKRPKKAPKRSSMYEKRSRVMNLVFYFMGQGLKKTHAYDQAAQAATAEGYAIDGETVAKDYARPRFKDFGTDKPVKITDKMSYWDGFIQRREVKENPKLIKQEFYTIWGFEITDEEFESLLKSGDK